MDPIVQAAVVTAGAKIVTKLIQDWGSSKPSDKNQKKVNLWLKRKNKQGKTNYDSLLEVISNDSVKLLDAIDTGGSLRVGDFLKVLYPKHGLKQKAVRLVKNELKYRLNFLAALGLMKPLPAIGRHQITRLGVAFLAGARAQRHYAKVLLRSQPAVSPSA